MPNEIDMRVAGWASAPRRRVAAVNLAGDTAARTFDKPSVFRCTADGTITATAWDGGTDELVGTAGDVFDLCEYRSVASGGSGIWVRYY